MAFPGHRDWFREEHVSQTSPITVPLRTSEEATQKNSGSLVEGDGGGKPDLPQSMKPSRHLEEGAWG